MTRVLLVEDEPDLADPLAYLLRREGFETEIAEDGQIALNAFRERGVCAPMNHVQPVDLQFRMLTHADRRAPPIPTFGTAALVERGAEETDDDTWLHQKPIFQDRLLYHKICSP